MNAAELFHDIKLKYLQNYLNEFCYKFNRRYFRESLFDRLMIASVSYKNQFRIKNGQSLCLLIKWIENKADNHFCLM